MKKIRLQDIPIVERRKATKDFDALPTSRRKVRAYFDANIPCSVAERVRTNLHWDLLCAQENPELSKQEDEFHYANARKLSRVLFTLDKDFLDDRRFPLHESPGVHVLHARQDDADDIYAAIWVASRFLTEAYRKLPDIYLRSKVLMTAEGQRLRYITKASEVHELFTPY